MSRRILWSCLGASYLLLGCGPAVPRFTTRATPVTESLPSSVHQLEGMASYYADEFHGRKTSNGEIYDMHELTAAHRTLPFDTKIRVTNLENGKSVVVRVNDRGPFKDNRVLDLSYAAARELGLIANGTAQVKMEVLEMGTDPKQVGP